MVVAANLHGQFQATSNEFTLVFGVETDPVDSVRLDQQHVDININYFGGAGEVSILADDLSDTNNPVSDSIFALDAAHLYSNANDRDTMVQSLLDAGYGFIGAAAGEIFWFISAFSGGDSIFLGISSAFDNSNQLVAWNPGDAAKGANFSDKFLRVELVSVNAPVDGEFAAFNIDNLGQPTVFMASSDGIDNTDTFYAVAGSHDHINWSFTQSGIYEITIRITTMVPESYVNWVWNNGIGDTTDTFNEASPSGLSYGVLYALGLHPTLSAPSAWPYTDLFEGKPAYYLELPESAPSDITYEIWKTTNLVNGSWSILATKVGDDDWSSGPETVTTIGGRTLYRYVESSTMSAHEEAFYQLRVSQ